VHEGRERGRASTDFGRYHKWPANWPAGTWPNGGESADKWPATFVIGPSVVPHIPQMLPRMKFRASSHPRAPTFANLRTLKRERSGA
jgi:hypothetical protein